jgi:hypothetical protein
MLRGNPSRWSQLMLLFRAHPHRREGRSWSIAIVNTRTIAFRTDF